MKILIVCSGNAPNFDFRIHNAFVYEQIEAVKSLYNIEYDTFFIKGKGFLGYISNLLLFYKQIRENKYSIIHAHYLLSGLFSRLQFKYPLIVTFHGSDINISIARIFSRILSYLTSYSIVVSEELLLLLKNKKYTSVIPCGVDTNIFYPMDKTEVRKELNLYLNKKYILFSSSFKNKVKNFTLAKQAIDNLADKNIEVIELKNKTREEVSLLMNAADLLLLTSHSEGSPQVIKEAMACNCPIVSTDVGDVKEIVNFTSGCYITSFNANEVAKNIEFAIQFSLIKGRTNGRDKVKHLDNEIIAGKICEIYKKVLDK